MYTYAQHYYTRAAPYVHLHVHVGVHACAFARECKRMLVCLHMHSAHLRALPKCVCVRAS